jgi:hypothetical protein
VLQEGVSSASAAAALSEDAISQGILASYVCGDYNDLPSWLDAYAALLPNTL